MAATGRKTESDFERIVMAGIAAAEGMAKRLCERMLARDDMPEGNREFFRAVRDGGFRREEVKESFLPLVIALGLMPERMVLARGQEPDFQTGILALAAGGGINRMWERFLERPGNARFSSEPLAGDLVIRILGLRAHYEAAVIEVDTRGLTTVEVGDELERAVLRLYRRIATN